MAVTTDVLTTLNLEGSDKGLRVVDFAFDGAYPAGGEAVAAGDVQLASIDFVAPVNKAVSDFVIQFNPTSSKLGVIVASTGLEAGAAAVGSLVARCLVLGTKEA